MYLCAVVPDTAAAPVYNLQWKTAAAEQQTWMYHASNGFVYFSGGDDCQAICKFSGGVAEWRIALNDNMQMHAGDTLDHLRMFVQDSANEWKLIEDLRATDIALFAPVLGDVNNDRQFDIVDLVLLQKWLLCVPGVELTNAVSADFSTDDNLDVFDLSLMKRALLD